MSKRDPKLLFKDILECAEKILFYTEDLTFEQFMQDGKTIDAVIRNYEVIGEAANRFPEEFKAQLPDLEWQKLRGFRNRLAHDCFGIDYKVVWDTKIELLPELIISLKKLLIE